MVTRRLATWLTLALGVGLVGLAGCVPEETGATDPMTGGPPIPQNKATAPPAGNANTTDLPVGSTASPAAIVSGPAPTIEPSADASHNLRITGTTGTTPAANWQPPPATTPTPAQLQDPLINSDPPVPVTLKGPTTTTTIANTQPIYSPLPGPARIDTYQQAQEALAARGVTGQQLRQIGDKGMWEFHCSVPDPHNQAVSSVYEVKAQGENGVAAMRLVIQKIDAEHPTTP
jgi:hypothetical protein